MKLPPYTLQEAKNLCAGYQSITGMPFDDEGNNTIDMVIVTPYDQNSKNRFLMLYLMLNDANAALSLDYSGNQYDVIVVSGSATAIGMQQKSLCMWHKANEQCCVDDTHTTASVGI